MHITPALHQGTRRKPGSRRTLAVEKREQRRLKKEQAILEKADKALRKALVQAAHANKKNSVEALRRRKEKQAARSAARLAEHQEGMTAEQKEADNAARAEARKGIFARRAAREASGFPQPRLVKSKADREFNAALYESPGWCERMRKIIEYCRGGVDFADAATAVYVAPLTAGHWFARHPAYEIDLRGTHPYYDKLEKMLVAALDELKEARSEEQLDAQAGLRPSKNARRPWQMNWRQRVEKRIRRLRKELGLDDGGPDNSGNAID